MVDDHNNVISNLSTVAKIRFQTNKADGLRVCILLWQLQPLKNQVKQTYRRFLDRDQIPKHLR